MNDRDVKIKQIKGKTALDLSRISARDFLNTKQVFALTDTAIQKKDIEGEHYKIIKKRDEDVNTKILDAKGPVIRLAIEAMMNSITFDRRMDVNSALDDRVIFHFSRAIDIENAKNVYKLFESDKLPKKIRDIFCTPVGLLTVESNNRYMPIQYSYIISEIYKKDERKTQFFIKNIKLKPEERISIVADALISISYLHNKGLKVGDVTGYNINIKNYQKIQFKSVAQMEAINNSDETIDEMLILLCQLESMRIIQKAELIPFIVHYLKLSKQNLQNALKYLRIREENYKLIAKRLLEKYDRYYELFY